MLRKGTQCVLHTIEGTTACSQTLQGVSRLIFENSLALQALISPPSAKQADTGEWNTRKQLSAQEL